MPKEIRNPKTEWALWLLCACFAVLPLRAQDDGPFTRLFDTAATSASPLTPEVLAKHTGWQLVPEDQTNHTFAGDTVLLNDKLAVVLRQAGQGAEVYARGVGGFNWRATVSLGRAQAAGSSAKIKVIENNASAVAVEAPLGSSGAAALRFRLTTGEAILEARAGDWAGNLMVQTKTRYVVVPDFFGDDVVYDAAASRETPACLPAENFCLNLLEGGDALMMSVWPSRKQECWFGRGEAPLIANRVSSLPGQGLWLAFLESPGIWRAVNAPDKCAMPFPARWRCDRLRENGLAESWDLEKPPPISKASGPVVIYPIDRSATTPLTATCPTDVMRNTLGVGPCQYILACEGLDAQGDPTPNNIMNWVEKQFEAKKEKKSADEIQERLEVMTKHVAEARTHLEQYRKFAARVRKALKDKPNAQAYSAMVDDLDRFAAAGTDDSASPDAASALAKKVRALIGKENSLAVCQELGAQLRSLGAAQDGAMARCRMAARRLKQHARTVLMNQPADAELAKEIKRLTEELLQEKAP